MEQEEEENICDDVIYADHGQHSRLWTRWRVISEVCTSTRGFLSRGLQFGV